MAGRESCTIIDWVELCPVQKSWDRGKSEVVTAARLQMYETANVESFERLGCFEMPTSTSHWFQEQGASVGKPKPRNSGCFGALVRAQVPSSSCSRGMQRVCMGLGSSRPSAGSAGLEKITGCSPLRQVPATTRPPATKHLPPATSPSNLRNPTRTVPDSPSYIKMSAAPSRTTVVATATVAAVAAGILGTHTQ